MTDSRTQIFSRLQPASPKSKQEICDDHMAIYNRLTEHKRGVLPAYAENTLSRFITKLTKVDATVKCINDIDKLSAEVYKYLSDNNIEATIVAAPSEEFKSISWQKEIAVEYRAAQAKDMTTLTMAYAGITETGSLVLCSSENSPTTLNFLPDNNICIIQQDKIYPYMEDAWNLLRKEDMGMPWAINFITGPSRTADVEQTIQLGAHGPRRLHVIILEKA